jgi:hypothetical protein
MLRASMIMALAHMFSSSENKSCVWGDNFTRNSYLTSLEFISEGKADSGISGNLSEKVNTEPSTVSASSTCPTLQALEDGEGFFVMYYEMNVFQLRLFTGYEKSSHLIS